MEFVLFVLLPFLLATAAITMFACIQWQLALSRAAAAEREIAELMAELARVRHALATPGPEDVELSVDLDDYPLH